MNELVRNNRLIALVVAATLAAVNVAEVPVAEIVKRVRAADADVHAAAAVCDWALSMTDEDRAEESEADREVFALVSDITRKLAARRNGEDPAR